MGNEITLLNTLSIKCTLQFFKFKQNSNSFIMTVSQMIRQRKSEKKGSAAANSEWISLFFEMWEKRSIFFMIWIIFVLFVLFCWLFCMNISFFVNLFLFLLLFLLLPLDLSIDIHLIIHSFVFFKIKKCYLHSLFFYYPPFNQESIIGMGRLFWTQSKAK